MDCSLPSSSVHGISQARIIEWVAISLFRGSSWPKDWTRVSCLGRWILSHIVVAELFPTLLSHELQHARPPCPSLFPGVCSNSCPLSQWCNPAISCSVIPLSSCPQFFPASGSFPVSQLLASGGQSIGASALASVLPMNVQGWFPLGLTGLISLLSKGLAGVFSSTAVRKHQFFGAQSSLWSNSHIHTWPQEKP